MLQTLYGCGIFQSCLDGDDKPQDYPYRHVTYYLAKLQHSQCQHAKNVATHIFEYTYSRTKFHKFSKLLVLNPKFIVTRRVAKCIVHLIIHKCQAPLNKSIRPGILHYGRRNKYKQDTTMYVKSRRFRVTIVAVEEQELFYNLSVCLYHKRYDCR